MDVTVITGFFIVQLEVVIGDIKRRLLLSIEKAKMHLDYKLQIEFEDCLESL